MLSIVDATHEFYLGIIQDLSEIYATRDGSKVGCGLNLSETEAIIRVKDNGDIPAELWNRIETIILRTVTKTFCQEEMHKDETDWWPVDMSIFDWKYQTGVYKGERADEIHRNRHLYINDAEDIRRDKLGLPPRTF